MFTAAYILCCEIKHFCFKVILCYKHPCNVYDLTCVKYAKYVQKATTTVQGFFNVKINYESQNTQLLPKCSTSSPDQVPKFESLLLSGSRVITYKRFLEIFIGKIVADEAHECMEINGIGYQEHAPFSH